MTEPQGPSGPTPPGQQGPWSPAPPPGEVPFSPAQPPPAPGVPPGAGPWQPPPGPPGAPVPGWPGQPPAKKSHTLRNVLVVVGAVVLLGIAAVVVAVVFFVKAVTGPADATNDYLAALKANKTSEAYSHLCRSLQDEIGSEEFVGIIRKERERNGPIVSYNVHSTEIVNGRGRTEYTLKRRRASSDIQAGLVKEDGEWKLCQFSG